MATTRWIQSYYHIVPPVLNNQSGSTWSLYNQNGYIPLNYVLLGDYDMTVNYWCNSTSYSQAIYRINLALAAGVGEEPVEVDYTELKAFTISNRVTVQYSLQNSEYIDLSVYDVSGRTVATLVDGFKVSGKYTSSWFPEKSGVYFVRLTTETTSLTDKVVILK
jgi:hypothetical protein